jgi:hypothetical protein
MSHERLGILNPDITNLEIAKKYYPDADFSIVSGNKLPKKVGNLLKEKTEWALNLGECLCDFEKVIKADHHLNDFTYISKLSVESVILVTLCDYFEKKVVGYSQIYYPDVDKNDEMIPQICGTETFNSEKMKMRRYGFGTRRVYLMNAVSQMFFDSPIYSDRTRTAAADALWVKLEANNRAKSIEQNGHTRYVFVSG